MGDFYRTYDQSRSTVFKTGPSETEAMKVTATYDMQNLLNKVSVQNLVNFSAVRIPPELLIQVGQELIDLGMSIAPPAEVAQADAELEVEAPA